MTRTAKTHLSSLTSSPFIHNLSAYGVSEVVTKFSRICVVIALARFMQPAEIGIAVTAMTTSEILKAITENGVGQRIIAARPGEVESICATAERIFWPWCIGLFALQCALGVWIYMETGEVLNFVMLALLGGEYLFMPPGSVQCALAMREGKLKGTAAVSAAQNVCANLLTAILVALWPSALSVVLPKVLVAPIWLIGVRRLRPWRRDRLVRPAPLRPFLRFGAAVMGIEIVKAIRMQSDKLIVGALLGADVLGVYYFAINAGLGIATSFSSAFSTVLFPHLCNSSDRAAALAKPIFVATALITPVVIAQALAAPFYVSIVFGAKWASVAPMVSILCLAAIPAVIWSAAAQWLRATGRAGTELLYSAAIAACLVGATIAATPFGLQGVVWAFLAASSISQLAASMPAIVSVSRTCFTAAVAVRPQRT